MSIAQHRTSRRRTARGAALLAAAGLALATAACGGGDDAEAAAPAPVAVGPENVVVAAVDRVQTGPLLSGSLRAREEAAIRAEVGGTVLQVLAQEGQRVNRGQLLARIEDAAVRDAFLSAQSAVSTAQGANQIARRDLERSRTLAAAGAIPTRDVEAAQVQLANTQSQLSAARAQLATARERLDATRVTAPISGVVSRRVASEGDVVAPGGELFTVIDPRQMELAASVPSEQLGALAVGTPVEFSVRGYPGQAFVGRIERISPAADPVTRQVPIYVSIPNDAGTLVSGLFAEGRVASETREGVVVPANAVDTEGPAPVVVRLRGGRVEAVPVQLGLRDARTERVEVVSGIAAGDTLLSGAAREVTPGSQVTIGRVTPGVNP